MITLQGINISHLGKRKIIFKMPFWGDMLIPWRVSFMLIFQGVLFLKLSDSPTAAVPLELFGDL